jgi:hypothetical protein
MDKTKCNQNKIIILDITVTKITWLTWSKEFFKMIKIIIQND